jgi:type I restriction enzyme, S subunit
MKHPQVALGEVADLIRGITYKPSDVCDATAPSAVACMRTKNVQELLDESDIVWIPASIIRNSSKYLKAGDILVSSANSWNLVGKGCWVPELRYPASAGGFISILRGKQAVVDLRYLYHWFMSPQTQGKLRSYSNKTTNISNLDHSRTLGTELPLPPLEEQRRIAAILDKVAALIASAEQAICLTQDLKKSAVDDFLASTNRDSSSERVKICEVANMITGFPFKSACYTDSADHTRLCRGINVLPGRIEWRQVARWPAVTPELRSYQIQEDDILIAMDRPWIGEGFKIAKARPGDAPSLLVQRVARLRAGNKILPRILCEVLSSKAFEAHCTPTETTVPHISPIEIREYEFPLPLLEKQKELDRILAGIEGIQLAMNRKATLLKEKLSAISREYFL